MRLVTVSRLGGILENTLEVGSAHFANSKNAEQLEEGNLCFPRTNASLYGARMVSSSELSADCKMACWFFILFS